MTRSGYAFSAYLLVHKIEWCYSEMDTIKLITFLLSHYLVGDYWLACGMHVQSLFGLDLCDSKQISDDECRKVKWSTETECFSSLSSLYNGTASLYNGTHYHQRTICVCWSMENDASLIYWPIARALLYWNTWQPECLYLATLKVLHINRSVSMFTLIDGKD